MVFGMADNFPHTGKIWRESSYDFCADKDIPHDNVFDFPHTCTSPSHEDPPSKLIGQFLHNQRATGDFSLDMDLEMPELQNNTNLPPISESLLDDTNVRKRYHFKNSLENKTNDFAGPKDGEIFKCSSRNDVTSSFKKKSNLFKERTKSKSRLMDVHPEPPEISGRVVPRSGQLRSGFLGRVSVDDEEDDPFDEDIPQEYRKDKLDIWVLLEWASLILIVTALVSSLAFPFLRNRRLWKLRFWKWEVLFLVLICGRLVSRWVIRIIVFFVERNFLLRKRVLYFVYGVKKAVRNCLWLGLVLMAWHFLFDKKVQRETRSVMLRYVTKVLICLVVGTLVWLVKTLVVKVLASSFNVNTYFDRIQESLFNQYVIETLSGPPLVEINMNEEEEHELAVEIQELQNAGAVLPPGLKATTPLPQPSRVAGSGMMHKSPPRKLSHRLDEGDDGITINLLHKLNPMNVSAWNMKRLMNIVRYGALSTLNEQIRDTSHDDDDESATKIRSEFEAKAAAKKIFMNVAKPGSRYIYLEDIMRFMLEDEALKAMNLFEGASESKKISKSCLKNWVVNAFRERRALALTLNDTKTAVKKLHRIVNVLVGSIVGVIWLLILGIATSKFLVFISSQLLLVAFIFGNTCKTVFESIIFLFVIHPFDVGDRCEIDGVQMVVEEMNILTTVFLRYDNQKIIIANSVLATKAISNYYRSPDMGDGVEFLVHVATPPEKIALMRQRIICYMENKKEHWYPSPMVIFKELEDLNKIRIAVWFAHRINHQDMGEKFLRRSLLLEEIVKIFRELDMQYRLLPLDINVRALPPVSSGRVPPSWAS
ncbi:mechanosensitive ion channel protein 6-like [Euphorbia lathyris]|uniref:mechanosensitive ion channel protein 6-like n=1 Tax=Euphorbia lathyris TaxID=212925 RepID=UPI003313B359